MTNQPENINLQVLIVRNDGLAYKINTDSPFSGIAVSYAGDLLYRSENYKNGKQHGLWELFHLYNEHGHILRVTVNYDNGKQHGLCEQFHENSQLKAKGNYKDDEKHGLWEEFYENGQIKS